MHSAISTESLARARNAAFLIPLVLAIGACGGGDKPAPAPPAVPQVGVLHVAARAVGVAEEYVAKTLSSRQVVIVSRVNGFLDKRLYEEGSFVKAGQVLYEIDPKPFAAQLQAARAALAQQEAALAVARANLERIKPLVAQDAVSRKDLDQAIGQEKQAAAALESARAQVVQAELNLGYATIRSPLSGLSSYSQIAEGSYVTATASLTHVSQISPIWVTFSIAENQILATRARTSSGQLRLPARERYQVELRLADGTLFPEKGQITFTDAEYNAQNGTFLVRAAFQNKSGLLRPGQFVTARISGAEIPQAILVPQRAVMQGPKGHFVWCLDKEGKTQYRPVSVGSLQGDDWLIDRGLAPGDVVVVDGNMTLRPGVPAKPVPSAPAPAAAKP